MSQTGDQPSTYTVSTTNNRLTSITGALTRTYAYDAAGNTTSDGTTTFTYNDAGRMISATKAGATTTFALNALGQRVKKTTAGVSTYFVYDEAGRLVGEYDGAGALIQETIWLGDIPVATIRPNGTDVDLFYIHTDHLNTPRRISRPSDNAIVWSWESDPFGGAAANEDPDGDSSLFVYNLRFPGQYFDAETGLHYNYFRDYDPQTGRYVQSDPIGLDGGINTYGYVDESPLSFVDPFGLSKGGDRNISTEGFNRNSDPKDVQDALNDALKKGRKKRAKALRALLKVIKRGGRSIVPPGLIERILEEQCAQGDIDACRALCELDPDRCEPQTQCQS